MELTRILIVDDHELFRKGIRSLLESSPGLMVCGEAASGLESVEKAKDLQPDVVLMDISMQGISGLDATRLIRTEVPKSKVVILSQHDGPQMVSAAIKVGASAFVTKSQAGQHLLRAIESVMTGQPFDWRPVETHQGANAKEHSPTRKTTE
ncbi:MAG TPA: response regulator transcription factor [Candidatus Acidoferrales bacterium]|nr:response regulator transcription factor [Candidatus Acidoferrales bacterium]